MPEGGRGGGDIGGSVGGSGGCINGGGGGNGCSNIAGSAGGDGYNGGGGTIGGSISGGRDNGKGSGNISSGVGGGGYNGGGGNTGGHCTDGGSVGDDGIVGGSAGGALDPMIASEPRRQLVPGGSVGGGINGGSGGIGGTVGGVDINGSGSGSIGGSVGADDGNGGGSNNGVSNSSSGIIGGSVGGALDPTVKSGPLRQSVPGGGSGYGNIGGSISGNGGGFCGGSVGIGGDNGSSGGGSADGALDSRFASKTYRQSVAQGGGGAGGNGGGGLNGSGSGSGGVHGGGSVDIGGSVCGVGINGNGGGSIGGSVGGGGGGDGGGQGGGSGTIGGRIGGVGVNGSGGGSTGGSVGGVGVTGSGGGSGNIDGRIGGVGVNGGGGGSIGGSSGGLGVNGVNGSGGGSISGSVGGGGGGNGDWDINDVSISSRIGGGIIGFRDSSGGDNSSGGGGITGGSVGDGGDSGAGGIGRSADGGADNRSGHLVPSSATMSTNPLDDSQVAPAAAEGVGEPSQAPSSAVCTQPAPPAMKNPVGRRSACGKAVCGDTTGWEDPCSLCDDKPSHAGRLLCSACHDGPMKKPRIKTRWVHIANVKDLEKSVRLWEAHLAATPGMKTIVKPGFRPTMSCLCIRPACYYMTWRKLDFAERRRNSPRCVACMTKNTAAWRPPGKELALIQRWLSEGEPSGMGVKENGTVLEADSRICDDCDAEFRNTGKKWVSEHAPKISMKTLDLYLRQRPAPHPGQARELVFCLVEREMLEILMKGRPVLLEDAVEMVVKARACAGYAEVQRARLVGQAVEVLECVSDSVTDAFYLCFDGEQVGESKRNNVRYLMPERIDFLYVAKLERAEKRLEREVSKLKEAAANKDEAVRKKLDKKVSKLKEAETSKKRAQAERGA